MVEKWILSAESPRCSLRSTLGSRRPIRQPPERSQVVVNDREGGSGGDEVIGTYDKRPRGGRNPGRARATRRQAVSGHSDRAADSSSLSDGLSAAAERTTTCKFIQECGVVDEPDSGRRHNRQRPVSALCTLSAAVRCPLSINHVRIPEIRVSWNVYHRRVCFRGCRWNANWSLFVPSGRAIFLPLSHALVRADLVHFSNCRLAAEAPTPPLVPACGKVHYSPRT